MGNRMLREPSNPVTNVPTGRILEKPLCKVSDSYDGDDQSTPQYFYAYSLVTHKLTYQKFYCKRMETSRLLDGGHDDNLRREVANMKLLTRDEPHANIVKLQDVIEDGHAVNLITELCSGGDLFHRMVKRTYSEPDAGKYFQQILAAVEHCHKYNVMHLDLKPENFLFLSPDKFPLKATELGHSVAFGSDQAEKRFQKLVGSAYYIAPEVLKRKYDSKADVWSAGVILYILLSGVPPFWAVDEPGILDSVLNGRLDFKSHPWPSISRDAKDFLKQMLQKDPTKRLSASEALEHRWMKVNGDPDFKAKLKKHNAEQKLKENVLMVLEKDVKFSDLKNMFEKMENDGFIKVKNFKKGIKKLNKDKTYSNITNSLKLAAMDEGGDISMNEFITGTVHIFIENSFRQAFNCDKKNNGYITEEEVKKGLEKINIIGDAADYILGEVAKTEIGSIDYKKIIELIMKDSLKLAPQRWRIKT